MKDLKVIEFIDQVASTDPTVGGGSVSALSGSFGVALMLMIARLMKNKDKFEEHHQTLDNMIETLEKMKDLFINYVELDSKAFEQVMHAFKMTKEDDQEKALRKQAIQEGFVKASLIPLQVMQRVVDVASIASELLSICPPSFISDGQVGVLMLNSCFEGAKKNVLINIDSIEDKHQKQQIQVKVDEASSQWKYYLQQIEQV